MIHTSKWFERREARLEEPLKNTILYYGKSALLKTFAGLPTVILPILGVVEFLGVVKKYRETVNFTTDYMRSGRAVTNDGPPGVGKTFTGANTAYNLAIKAWAELQEDYFTQKAMVPQWVKVGDSDKLEAFKSLEESYKVYRQNIETNIPCLISSIPLREYGTGRMSYQLTPEMFLQTDRVPERTILFIDEIGEDQGVSISETKNPNYLAFWRFPRHFFDGKFVNTNQDGSQAAIAVRRSTDYVNRIIGQKWIDRPAALEAKFERKKRRYYKLIKKCGADDKRAKHLAQELYFLKKYIATIGFREISCQLRTIEGSPVGEVQKFILPAIGGVQYDDRTYRNQYKCRNETIGLRGWEKLTIEEYDHSGFAAQIKSGNNGKGKAPKRRGGA